MITELMLQKYDQYLQEDLSFKNVLEKDLTKQFWDDMDNRVNNSINNFFVLFVFGEQGTAKSGVAQLIMQKYVKEFPVKNILYTDRQVIERMKDSKKGDSFIKDETPIKHGAGAMIDKNMIKNFINQMRASKNNFIFINPTRINMDGCHYMLHTLLFDEEEKKVRAGLLDNYYFRYMGYVDFDLKPIWNNRLWKEYEKLKQNFLEEAKKQDYTALNLTESAKKVMEHPNFHRCLNSKGKLVMGYLKNLVSELFSNIGLERQKNIHFKVKEIMEHGVSSRPEEESQESLSLPSQNRTHPADDDQSKQPQGTEQEQQVKKGPGSKGTGKESSSNEA